MSISVQKREEIKKNIEKVVAARESELAGFKAKLDDALKKAESANEESAKFSALADAKGYHKSQDEFRANTDAADMFRNKIAELEKAPYITESEFQDAANTIYAELNDEVEAAGAEIAELVKKIMEIGDRTSDSISKWEKYVLDMQLNVRKDKCNLIMTNGVETNVPDNSRKKTFKNRDIFSYVDAIRNHYFINKYLGEIKKENIVWGRARN